MGPSCFGGYKIQGLWRLDPQWMKGEKDRETERVKGGKVEGDAPSLLFYWSTGQWPWQGRSWAADWHLPTCLIYQRLWGISSTCWFVKANKQFHVHTHNNMFVTLSPVSYGGNWSSCQKQRDKSLQGITVVVVLLWNRESYIWANHQMLLALKLLF